MTHSLPVPVAGWSPKHALTLTMTPSQALAICSSGNYGIRHLELWFIGIFFPPHSAHSERPQTLSLSQAPQQGVLWSAGQHLGAQHLQEGQMRTHTAPHPSLLPVIAHPKLSTLLWGCRTMAQPLMVLTHSWDGLQSSGGRLQSCFEEHESRLKCHKDVAKAEKMFAFWLGCYPPHYAELFPRCLHSSCKRKKPKCPR